MCLHIWVRNIFQHSLWTFNEHFVLVYFKIPYCMTKLWGRHANAQNVHHDLEFSASSMNLECDTSSCNDHHLFKFISKPYHAQQSYWLDTRITQGSTVTLTSELAVWILHTTHCHVSQIISKFHHAQQSNGANTKMPKVCTVPLIFELAVWILNETHHHVMMIICAKFFLKSKNVGKSYGQDMKMPPQCTNKHVHTHRNRINFR